jgi:hypothetical protein
MEKLDTRIILESFISENLLVTVALVKRITRMPPLSIGPGPGAIPLAMVDPGPAQALMKNREAEVALRAIPTLVPTPVLNKIKKPLVEIKPESLRSGLSFIFNIMFIL